jgi:hypothetical protein
VGGETEEGTEECDYGQNINTDNYTNGALIGVLVVFVVQEVVLMSR